MKRKLLPGLLALLMCLTCSLVPAGAVAATGIEVTRPPRNLQVAFGCDLLLDVNMHEPDNYKLTYQWYDYTGTALEGATSYKFYVKPGKQGYPKSLTQPFENSLAVPESYTYTCKILGTYTGDWVPETKPEDWDEDVMGIWRPPIGGWVSTEEHTVTAKITFYENTFRNKFHRIVVEPFPLAAEDVKYELARASSHKVLKWVLLLNFFPRLGYYSTLAMIGIGW